MTQRSPKQVDRMAHLGENPNGVAALARACVGSQASPAARHTGGTGALTGKCDQRTDVAYWRTMSRFPILIALLLAVFAPAHALQLTDDRGVELQLAQPPQRIVTLLPSLTETVCELGACDRLVCVDNYSNWPASVQQLPHLGGLEDASIERIVALRPEVVLLSTSSRALGRLESLGLKVVALEPKTFADVQRVISKVGQLVGADSAPLWRRIEAGVAAAGQGLPAQQRGTRVYFEVNSAPYAASESSFIGELLSRVGLFNVVPGSLGPFPKLNPNLCSVRIRM